MLKTFSHLKNTIRYVVQGDSMAPRFKRGQHLLAERSETLSAPPSRGDVLVVLDPGTLDNMYIKRVVGLPGERVTLKDSLLYLNDIQTTEPYLNGMPSSPGSHNFKWILDSGEYIVLGDNRPHSTDSRSFGPIDIHQVIGRVWFRYWPPNRWGHTK